MPFKKSNSFNRGWLLLPQAQLWAVSIIASCITDDVLAGINNIGFGFDYSSTGSMDFRVNYSGIGGIDFKVDYLGIGNIDFKANCL